MRGDGAGDEEPNTPDEGTDSEAFSVEDFDDFAPVEELLVDGPQVDAEPAAGKGVPPERDAGIDEDTEELEAFQPGFAFAGEDGADEETADRTAADEAFDALPEDDDDAPGFGDLWASNDDDGDSADEVEADSVPAAPFDQEVAAQERLDEITTERLHSTSTQEYAGLAEHVARAADEDQELMAVAADMPGLERGIVGLDDVVEASGVEDAPEATRRSSDLPLRVGTAVLLLAVFIGSLYRPLFLGLLALIVLGLAAGEFYTVLVRSGFNPLTVFGLAGVIGAMVGTWVFGPVAIPMSLASALLLTLIFYTVVSGRSLPLFNAALTMMVAVWVGLGAFLFDMVQSPDFRWLIVAFIVTVAVMDICQYFVGRRLGRTPLAPRISPKKTVEGLVGGIFGALMVGVFFGLFESGPFDLGSGLLLGLLVAVVAPFGDLAISVVKRALDVKDMGTILPGHGGVLDRIDAMLMVVPVAWVAYAWLGLLS